MMVAHMKVPYTGSLVYLVRYYVYSPQQYFFKVCETQLRLWSDRLLASVLLLDPAGFKMHGEKATSVLHSPVVSPLSPLWLSQPRKVQYLLITPFSQHISRRLITLWQSKGNEEVISVTSVFTTIFFLKLGDTHRHMSTHSISSSALFWGDCGCLGGTVQGFCSERLLGLFCSLFSTASSSTHTHVFSSVTDDLPGVADVRQGLTQPQSTD